MLIIFIGIAYFIYAINNKTAVDIITTDKKYENVVYDQEENVFLEDIIGTLIIEKISLHASIKEGSTAEILKKYVGHIEGTSVYDGNIRFSST